MTHSPRLVRPLITTLAFAALAAPLLGGCSPSASELPTATARAAGPPGAAGSVAVARGKIDVEGGLLELAPAIEGTVQQLPLKEGQRVQAGQLLLRMADDASRADLGVAESEWRLAQTREKAKSARLPPLAAALKRWQTAAREGAADANHVSEAAQQLRDAQSERDIAAAEVKVAQAKVEQLRRQQKRFQLQAPEAATVVHIKAHVGGQAGPQQTAVSLLPQRPLIVRAELNESFANAVREGMRASVVFDGEAGSSSAALPAAKVLRISPMFGAARLQDDTQRGPIRVIECVLEFDNPPIHARVGQNVRVSFHE
ncbi:efflux RND transporter periplasmic adaptor subunit [Comamonas sp. J-3]|uniref:efflux RND transporter periplasmic adaptor subunit n=1 Tax=Comamonas trifloxystrobinivorans TaxID=3350256 RepID=UPI003729B53D